MALPYIAAHTSQPYSVPNSTTTGAIDTANARVIVVMAVRQSNTAGTLSDSKGNTWSVTTPTTQVSDYPSYIDVLMTSGTTPNVGAGHTFTFDAVGGYSSVFVLAFAPSVGGALTVTTMLGTYDYASPYDSPPITTEPALLIGMFVPLDGAGDMNATWGNGFSQVEAITPAAYWQMALAQLSVATAGTYTATVTDTQNPTQTGVGIYSVLEAPTNNRPVIIVTGL